MFVEARKRSHEPMPVSTQLNRETRKNWATSLSENGNNGQLPDQLGNRLAAIDDRRRTTVEVANHGLRRVDDVANVVRIRNTSCKFQKTRQTVPAPILFANCLNPCYGVGVAVNESSPIATNVIF
jgi:hypothetical protein